MGDRDVRVLVLHWKGDCKNVLSSDYDSANEDLNASFLNRQQKESNKVWNSIGIQNTTSLIKRIANIDVELTHDEPLLVLEYYTIRMRLVNLETFTVDNLK
jgi:hypothetical protein